MAVGLPGAAGWQAVAVGAGSGGLDAGIGRLFSNRMGKGIGAVRVGLSGVHAASRLKWSSMTILPWVVDHSVRKMSTQCQASKPPLPAPAAAACHPAAPGSLTTKTATARRG